MEMEPAVEDIPRPPEEKEIRPIDYGNVSNTASNENAELNARLRDAAGSDARELYEDAEGLNDRMEANREAYEAGLRRTQEMIENARRQPSSQDGGDAQSTRRGGNVTASYSFANPVRHDQRLDIPAYRCLGGGQIVVSATLDQNGNVVSAEVERGSTDDPCLQREALASARASQFNMDTSAPTRHRGSITYIFIPQ